MRLLLRPGAGINEDDSSPGHFYPTDSTYNFLSYLLTCKTLHSTPPPKHTHPSRQVGSQPATEALPLVMEPESRLYSCPVVVLDFQSLYPSLVIAYNLCYTTMVGRPTHAAAAVAAATAASSSSSQPTGTPASSDRGRNTPSQQVGVSSQQKQQLPQQQPPGVGIRMGVSSYSPPVAALVPGGAADPEGLVIAPSGVAFLPPRVRPGVLPRLLHEILATRVMVKAAMKRCKADKVRLSLDFFSLFLETVCLQRFLTLSGGSLRDL